VRILGPSESRVATTDSKLGALQAGRTSGPPIRRKFSDQEFGRGPSSPFVPNLVTSRTSGCTRAAILGCPGPDVTVLQPCTGAWVRPSGFNSVARNKPAPDQPLQIVRSLLWVGQTLQIDTAISLRLVRPLVASPNGDVERQRRSADPLLASELAYLLVHPQEFVQGDGALCFYHEGAATRYR
jgi:hypothetical protein